jgi:hypothetical protein
MFHEWKLGKFDWEKIFYLVAEKSISLKLFTAGLHLPIFCRKDGKAFY